MPFRTSVDALRRERPVDDLTHCDREPITRLDRIQNFGFLVALSNDWTVIRASANLGVHLGIAAVSAIGGNFARIVGADAQTAIRDRMAMLYSTGNERLFGIRLVADRPAFDLNLHFVDDVLVIEGEPSLRADSHDAASMVRSMMAQLGKTAGLDAFQRIAAQQVRDITGFDRVMVYRFDSVGNGEVVAESAGPRIESFLGLQYPASDIPQQARALYLANPFRIISDVGETPVALLPVASSYVPPLDLSQAITRAVSPIHIEYLTNMGVGATLSISIIVGGELWGLFACHHYAPRLPSFTMRTAAELFGEMYSLALESRLGQASAAIERRARFLTDRIIAGIAANESLLSDPQWLHVMMSGMIDYDGMAIYRGGDVHSHGDAPCDDDIRTLARNLALTSPSHVFATDRLASLSPADAPGATATGGVLAIPISRAPRDYILLFRREWLQSIQWAGEPGKVSTREDGFRLSPRKSFAVFCETIRGKSRPFTNDDRRIGEALRSAVVEVVLHLSALKIDALAAEIEARREVERALRAEINTRRIMATAIAHDLNQPLAAITAFLEGMGRLAERGDTAPALLEKILHGSRQAAGQAIRAGNILKLLRASVTRDDTVRTDEDIAVIIKDSLALALTDSDGLDVTFTFEGAAQGMIAAVNRIQIRQVLGNLIQNAVEAVDGTDLREVTVTLARDASRGVLSVDVADTGPGISADMAKELFTPFLSNKPHGMGIGLSISREIIEDHHGKLTTRPNPGGGAIFSFCLPLGNLPLAA